MQDKAIAAIGEWQLQENKDLEPVDLYIENISLLNLNAFLKCR